MNNNAIQLLIGEFERESAATARVLDRVPQDNLGWRPHAKSRTIGELAWHVASIPGRLARVIEAGTFEVGGARPPAQQGSDFSAELKRGVEETKRALGSLDEAALTAPFTMKRGDNVLMSLPRIAAIRALILNHSYHHRGQLTVYLRLLDIPVPAVYGASADENPFA